MVIAILQLVFGGIGLLCWDPIAIFMLVSGSKANTMMAPPAAQGAPNPAELQEKIEKLTAERVPYHKTITFGSTIVVSPALGLAMIASGIGLLWMKTWGRILAILYALAGIVMKIATAIITIMVIPAMKEVMQEFLSKDPKVAQATQSVTQMMPTIMYMGVFFSLFTMVYPVLVLVLMFLPSTKAALRGEITQASAKGPEDYRDEPLS